MAASAVTQNTQNCWLLNGWLWLLNLSSPRLTLQITSALCFFHSYIIYKSSVSIHTPRPYLKIFPNSQVNIVLLLLSTIPFIFPVTAEKERASGSGLSIHHWGSGGTWSQWGWGGGRGHVCVFVIGAQPSSEPRGCRWEVSTEPTQPEDHGAELQEVSEEDPGNYSHHFRPLQPQPQVSLITIDLSVCLSRPASLWLCVLCLLLSFFSAVHVVRTRAELKVRNNICMTFHCLLY